MPLPPTSIYSKADPRYNNPQFNQVNGAFGGIQTPFYGQGGIPGSTTTGAQTGSSALPGFTSAPEPTGGRGAYGMVPGTIGIPPSAWDQTIGVAPGLGDTSQLTHNIMSELQGDINPQALKNMQDAAASYGVSSGMPGSNAVPGTLAFNKNLRNIGLDTLAVQRQGQQDYLSALTGIGGTQTPQSLAAEIAAHNAQLKAAPDPQLAAEQQQRDYWNALNSLRGPGGGTRQGPTPGAGTGAFNPGAGALGFGFGGFGGQGGVQSPSGGSGGFYGGSSSTTTTPGGSSLTWNGGLGTDLFGDLGEPAGVGPTYGGAYQQPDASNPDYWNFGFDQSAQPDFSGLGGAIDNPEDYYADYTGF